MLLCGGYPQNYNHVFEMRNQEAQQLTQRLKKVKSEKAKEALKAELTQMEALNKEVQLKQRKAGLEEEWKKREREQTKQGKKPYFLSQCRWL